MINDKIINNASQNNGHLLIENDHMATSLIFQKFEIIFFIYIVCGCFESRISRGRSTLGKLCKKSMGRNPKEEAHDLQNERGACWAGPKYLKKQTANKFHRRGSRSRGSNSQNPNPEITGKFLITKFGSIWREKEEKKEREKEKKKKKKQKKLKTLAKPLLFDTQHISRLIFYIHGKRRQRERGRARRHVCTLSMQSSTVLRFISSQGISLSSSFQTLFCNRRSLILFFFLLYVVVRSNHRLNWK